MRFFILLFFLLPLTLLGQTVTIQGYVVTSKNERISNVRIKVGNSIAVYTDSDGFFSTKIPVKNNLNVRVPVEAAKTGYQTYQSQDLIITDGKTKTIDNIVLLKEGELSNAVVSDSAKDKGKIIDGNAEIIGINQTILNKANYLPVQYQTEIQAIITEIKQLAPAISEIQKRVADLDKELKNAQNKDRLLLDLLTKEQSVLAQQERIFGKQEAIFQALSAQTAKANTALEMAQVKWLDNNAIEITFRFKDAFGNTPPSGQTQVIGVSVAQLTGGNNQKLLTYQPQEGELASNQLKRNLDLSQTNTLRFESSDAFKRKYLKKGLIIQFYLGDTLLGSHGYRL